MTDHLTEPLKSTAEDLRAEDAMRRATVRDAIDLLGYSLVTVRTTATPQEIMMTLVRHKQRTLPVVDAEGRLVGVIRAWNVVDQLFFHIAPTEFLAELFSRGGVERFKSLAGAESAAEMMIEPHSIHLDERLTKAFHLMHAHELEGLPVVDERERVVGQLDRLGILRVWLRLRGWEMSGSRTGAEGAGG